ncbi:hypothetical protein [Shewanella xiamenensis]|uniref:hypothetical protein n=1 Tax=Shewanella xiamenensis TaxID=332186 RepID=UPI0015594C73|nr:hypothetical protein [Shewanella xiamenensis]
MWPILPVSSSAWGVRKFMTPPNVQLLVDFQFSRFATLAELTLKVLGLHSRIPVMPV